MQLQDLDDDGNDEVPEENQICTQHARLTFHGLLRSKTETVLAQSEPQPADHNPAQKSSGIHEIDEIFIDQHFGKGPEQV